jgi:CheY-like chemotaxis protein
MKTNLTEQIPKEENIKILIVEDTENAAQRLQRTLERSLESVEIEVEPDFDKALSKVTPPRSFEAVVLDLYLGDPLDESNKVGEKVWERIWEKKLVPVIVHTGGNCELDPPLPENNPFVTCITKKMGSDDEVANYLLALKPHILALRQVEEEFNKTIHSVLADTSPLIWRSTEADERLRSELLVRSARRRLAAMMDLNTVSSNELLLSWEQYVYPPLGDSLLTGDILQDRNTDARDPATYRVMLTPSCDTQMNQGKCKVDAVLVAKCANIDNYTRVANVAPQKIVEKLPRLLTEPQQGGYVPLPEYKSVLPCMAANLRSLELIPINEIDITGSSSGRFLRVVSVDSPFREHIAWAYLQVAGRPGVPNRDLDKWAQEIKATIENTTSGAASTEANPK